MAVRNRATHFSVGQATLGDSSGRNTQYSDEKMDRTGEVIGRDIPNTISDNSRELVIKFQTGSLDYCY